MSSSVLSQRLTELTAAGIVTADDEGTYHLTELGGRLEDALSPLLRWSHEWQHGLEA
jgi:DNA-binding HxlR family transcriptional regulator